MDYGKYDYIICGSGPSGSLLANKLSKHSSVLLLEFGNNNTSDPQINDPLLSGSLVLNYTNEYFYPGGHEGVLPNRQQRNPLVSGATLGGGSSVNGFQFVRGTNTFYEKLQEITDDDDYSPENAVKIYKQIERFDPVNNNIDDRGKNGRLDVRQATANLQAATLFTNAANNVLAVPIVEDYNNLNNEIVADKYWQLTQNPQKTRESAYNAYIDYITYSTSKCDDVLEGKCGRDIKVLTGVFVTKVIFNKHKEAIGVEVVHDEEHITLKVNKEVILSCGFQSALILQRSGIGPEQILKDNCVKSIFVNENVGNNILNHPIVSISGTGQIPQTVEDPQALYSGVVFLGDDTSSDPNSRAFQLIGIPTPTGFLISSLMLDAKSKGSTYILGKNPAHMPKLDFRYFSDPADRVSVVNMVNKMIAILTDPNGLNLTLDSFGGNTNPTFEDIERIYSQAYHWVGSSRIGTSSEDGVVDNECKVFGVKGLRVVDSTVFPINCLGNAMAPAYYIGQLIANKIKKEYNK